MSKNRDAATNHEHSASRLPHFRFRHYLLNDQLISTPRLYFLYSDYRFIIQSLLLMAIRLFGWLLG